MLLKRELKYRLAGKRFGNWLVTDHYESRPRTGIHWRCQCTCGAERLVRAAELLGGRSLSCGCTRWPDRGRPVKAKTVMVQYRWYNRSKKQFDGWEYFGRVTEANAAKLMAKNSPTLEYRIVGATAKNDADTTYRVMT